MSDLKTYTSRHRSLFQSLVEEVETGIAEEQAGVSFSTGPQESETRNPDHPMHDEAQALIDSSPADPSVELPESFGVGGVIKTCASISWEIFRAKASGDTATVTAKMNELKFSTCDPKWADSVAKYLQYFGPTGKVGDIPYIRHKSMDDFVSRTLAPNAKIALIADWGTGTDEAKGVLQEVAKHNPDVLIHLGDIYYSGTPDEAQKYFLDLINEVFDRPNNKMAVYNLTGNHDMYSGGAGFYGILKSLNPSPPFAAEQAQEASYFALQSTDGAWQLLGMDTGLHDHDPFTVSTDVTYLEPSEEAWHVDKIQKFTEGGGRTILLSHHQLFSAYETIGKIKGRAADVQAANPLLYESYKKFAAAGDVAAWFWGHEHNLTIYQPYLGLAKGRCIGHGAIPVFGDQDPYVVKADFGAPPKLIDDPRNPGQPLQLGLHDKTYTHGFVILELDDATRTATASYYEDSDPDTPMYVETL